MAATVTRLYDETAQPAFQAAPIEPELRASLALMFKAGFAEGYRSRNEELCIAQPPLSLAALDEHTASACAKILSLARQ